MMQTFTLGDERPFIACLSMFLLFSFLAGSATAQTVNIPDQNFKAALLADPSVNTNGDDEIQVTEAESVSQLDVSGEGIADLTGISAFTGLSTLNVNDNELTSLDVSAITYLSALHASNNEISEISFHDQFLLSLNLSNNALTELDVSSLGLDALFVDNNNLNSLKISAFIEYFDARNNPDLTCIEVPEGNSGYEDTYGADNVDPGVTFSTDCSAEESVVYIPDSNFKSALLADEAINTNGDDDIQVSEAATVHYLNVSGHGISDMTGILSFINLATLDCSNNSITELDLTGLNRLEVLYCQNNKLTHLELNSAPSEWGWSDEIFANFNATGNPNLTCIDVDDVDFFIDNFSDQIDPGASFSFDCDGDEQDDIVNIPDDAFKQALVSGISGSYSDLNGDGEVQYSEIMVQDVVVMDVSGLGISDLTGIDAFYNLEALDCSDNHLTSLDISKLQDLPGVDCSNNQIEEFLFDDFLSHLDISNNRLTSFTIPGEDGAGFFIELDISSNQLVALDISASDYTLDEFDATDNPELSCIEVEDPADAEARWSDNVDTGVTFSTDCSSDEPVVYIPDSNFKSALLADEAINTNGDNEIQVSETEGVERISFATVEINDLTGIGAFNDLLILAINNTSLSSVDLSGNDQLRYANFNRNELTEIIIPASLQNLLVGSNNFTELDVSGSFLQSLIVSGNNLTKLNVANGRLTQLKAEENQYLDCIQVSDVAYAEANWRDEVDTGVLFSTNCSDDPIVYIPDPNFKAALLANVDLNTNGDDEIQQTEAFGYTGTIKVNGEGIEDLTGIEEFVNLTQLKAHYNNLNSVDLSANSALKKLHLQGNELTSLDLSGNPSLEMLRAQNNDLTSLDLSENPELEYLEVQNNALTSLNVQNGNNENTYKFDARNNPDLTCVQVDDAALAEEHISEYVDEGVEFSENCGSDEPVVYIPDANFKAALLADTDINTNGDDEIQVSETDGILEIEVPGAGISDPTGVRAFPHVTSLIFDDNNLTSLNVRNMGLTSLSVRNNDLHTLELGPVVEYLSATGNPDLSCIQTDDPNYYSGDYGGEADPGVTFSTWCGSVDEPVVYIPDANFKAALLADDYINLNRDDEIQVFEAEQTDGVYVADKNISDMTGLEAFVNLRYLHCYNNSISSLDLSHVVVNDLSDVRCYNNQITEIKLPGYTPNYFLAQNNQIQELELYGYAEWVDVSNNDLQSLKLFMSDSPVTSWWFVDNPDLTCVEVNSVAYAEDNWSYAFDDQVSFSTDCSSSGDPVVYIPDANFKAALIADEAINTNGDGEIQVSEAEAVTGTIKVNGEGISDLTGIEAFVNLYELKAHYNELTSVDLSANTALVKVHLQGNDLTSLDLNANTMLDMLRAQSNDLTSLDLSANISLRYLEVQNNALVSLNIRNGNNSAMYKFEAGGNPDLTCIEVDDAAYAASEWSDDVDGSASFSEDCSGGGARIAAQIQASGPKLNVSIHPNPSSDFMRVVSDEEPDELHLFSLKGDEMNVRFVDGEADIRHLKQGMYILKILTGDQTATMKVVKQ